MARIRTRRGTADTPSITSAARSHQQDIDSRMARYALAMAIRTACFFLLFVVPWPWKWFVAVGAIVLPYVAVLIANAGRERLPVSWGTGQRPDRVASPHDGRDGDGAAEATPEAVMPVQVVQGETVDREGGDGRPAGDEAPGSSHAA